MSNGELTSCPVCESDLISADYLPDSTDPWLGVYQIVCPRCGTYYASHSFFRGFHGEMRDRGKAANRFRSDLSAWIRERNDKADNHPKFELSFLLTDQQNDLREEFEKVGTPTFPQQTDKLLLALKQASDYFGQNVRAFASKNEQLAWEARAWALNEKEFAAIIDHLVREGLVDGDRVKDNPDQLLNLRLTGKGLERIEKKGGGLNDSAQGFVAMWLNDEVMHIFDDAFVPAIKNSGYWPFKIDDRPTPDRIDERIEAEIRASCFMVADLSDHRPSVYFEAGYARALGKPVIWTCRDDYFDDLHFDIRQFYCHKWSRYEPDKLVDPL